jgi:hypothetical protein
VPPVPTPSRTPLPRPASPSVWRPPGRRLRAVRATDTLISIENLIGSGFNDNLTGNCGAGNNVSYDGGTGNDTMLGGDGNDYYYVRDSGDIVSETNATASTGGTDLVYSYLSSYTLGANVENGRIVASAAANLSGNASTTSSTPAPATTSSTVALAATPSATPMATARPASPSASPRPPRRPPAARAPTP